MQDEIDLKDDNYRLVSDKRFNANLDTNNHNEMRSRNTQRRY